MRRMGWFLLLFFFPWSSNPLQNPFQPHLQNSLVSVFKENQNARNSSAVGDGLTKIRFGEEKIRRVRRLQGHGGGHSFGGHSGGHLNGGGHGGGGGVMSHHNNVKNNGGADSCTTNHNVFVHVVFLVLPFLFT